MALILVVEDQGALNDLIRVELEGEGHRGSTRRRAST